MSVSVSSVSGGARVCPATEWEAACGASDDTSSVSAAVSGRRLEELSELQLTQLACLVIEDVKSNFSLEVTQRDAVNRALAVSDAVALLKQIGDVNMVESVLTSIASSIVRNTKENTTIKGLYWEDRIYESKGKLGNLTLKSINGSLREEQLTSDEREQLNSALSQLVETGQRDNRFLSFESGAWRYSFSGFGRFVYIDPRSINMTTVTRVIENGEIMYRITRHGVPVMVGGVLTFGHVIQDQMVSAKVAVLEGARSADDVLRIVAEQSFQETFIMLEESKRQLQQAIKELVRAMIKDGGVGDEVAESQLGLLSPMIVSPMAMRPANAPAIASAAA